MSQNALSENGEELEKSLRGRRKSLKFMAFIMSYSYQRARTLEEEKLEL